MSFMYGQVSGKDIAELVARVESMVDGEPNLNVSIACFIVAVLSQNPEVAPDKLLQLVKGLSEYVAANLFDDGVVN